MEVRPWNGTNHTSGKSYAADIVIWGPGSQKREHYCEREGPSGILEHRPCFSARWLKLPVSYHKMINAVRSAPDNFGGFASIYSADGSPVVCACGSAVRTRQDCPIWLSIECPTCTKSEVKGCMGRVWECGACSATGRIDDGKLVTGAMDGTK